MPSGPELDTFKKAFWLGIPHFWVKWRTAAQTSIGSYENMCLRRTHLQGGTSKVWLCQGRGTDQKTEQQNEGGKTKRRGRGEVPFE